MPSKWVESKAKLRLLCPIFALALSACGSTGKRPSPPVTCPAIPPLPSQLSERPNYEQSLRHELFESEPKPTPR